MGFSSGGNVLLMAEQLIKKNADVMGARNLGMKLANNSLMKNPEPNFLRAQTEAQTEVVDRCSFYRKAK